MGLAQSIKMKLGIGGYLMRVDALRKFEPDPTAHKKIMRVNGAPPYKPAPFDCGRSDHITSQTSHPPLPNSPYKAPPRPHTASLAIWQKSSNPSPISFLQLQEHNVIIPLSYHLKVQLRPRILGCAPPLERRAFMPTAAPSTTTSASQTAAPWHISRVANER